MPEPRRLHRTQINFEPGRFDLNFETIAARFGVSTEAIFALNPNILPPPIATSPLPDHAVHVPIAEDLLRYEWLDYTTRAGDTLQAICERFNRNLLRGNWRDEPHGNEVPELTPGYLWNLVLNWRLRAEHLEMAVGEGGADNSLGASDPHVDQHPGGVALVAGHTVKIPFVARPLMQLVGVAPTTELTQDVIDDEVDAHQAEVIPWSLERLLRLHLMPIRRKTDALRAAGVRYRDVAEQVLAAAQPIAGIDALLDFQQHYYPETGGAVRVALRAVLDRVSALVESPTMSRLSPETAQAREGGARGVWNEVHDGDFHDLMAQYLDAADVMVLSPRQVEGPGASLVYVEESVHGMICTVLADAYMQLLLVPEFEERAAQEIIAACDAAVTEGSADRTRTVRGPNPLATALSLACVPGRAPPPQQPSPGDAAAASTPEDVNWSAFVTSASSMLTLTAGNLPGPPSLMGAVVSGLMANRLRYAQTAPEIVRQIHGRAIEWLPRAMAYTAEQRSELSALLARAPGEGASAEELRTFRASLAEHHDRVAGRFQAGTGWCKALTVLNLIGLYAAITADVPGSAPNDTVGRARRAAIYFTGVLSADANAAASVAAGMMARLGQTEGGWARLATGLGHTAAILSLLSNVLKCWEVWVDPHSTDAQGWRASLDVVLTAATFFPIPWVAAASLGIQLGFALEGMMVDSDNPPVKQAMAQHVTLFRRADWIHRLLGTDPTTDEEHRAWRGHRNVPDAELVRLTAALDSAISNAALPIIYDDLRGEAMQRLRSLRFTEEYAHTLLVVRFGAPGINPEPPPIA